MYDSVEMGTRLMAYEPKKPKRSIYFLPLLIGALLLLGGLMVALTHTQDIALLHPKGMIANEQHRLMITSTLIMLCLAVPVIAAIYFIVWKYREENQASTPPHSPPTKNHNSYLLFAWGAPIVIVAILSALMIPATHHLQPQAAIQSANEQITVKVVALPWKWLFIYPGQNIATVNFTQIPINTPVRYELTADAMPMSSFWIPHLGGMLYAMTGHVNPINLMGDTVGDYTGSTAEINGPGFAGMRFTTRVSSKEDFDKWVADTKQSKVTLDEAEYQKLLEPSENYKAAFYTNPSPDLFDTIVKKYQHNMDMSHREAME